MYWSSRWRLLKILFRHISVRVHPLWLGLKINLRGNRLKDEDHRLWGHRQAEKYIRQCPQCGRDLQVIHFDPGADIKLGVWARSKCIDCRIKWEFVR